MIYRAIAGLVFAVLLSGCVQMPPEAADVRALGDGEVSKIRILADDAIDEAATLKLGMAWGAWREEWDSVKDAAGKVSADYAEQSIEMRNAALERIEGERSAKHDQAAALHENQRLASESVLKSWEKQGQLNAQSFSVLRDTAFQAYEAYRAHQAKKDAARAARKAKEAAEAAAHEGGHE